MAQAILFDLGNVLVFFSFPKMIRQMAECTGLSEAEIKTRFFETQLRERYETGAISTDILYQTFRSASPKQFTKPELLLAISDIFTPNEEIYPLLHALKKKGHRLILLSNTSDAHFSFLLPRLPHLALFDQHVLSYEVGSIKPDPSIFQAALLAAAHPPEKCFYTDDIPEFIAAGKAQGIDSEVYTDVQTLEAQLARRALL